MKYVNYKGLSSETLFDNNEDVLEKQRDGGQEEGREGGREEKAGR